MYSHAGRELKYSQAQKVAAVEYHLCPRSMNGTS